MLRVRDDSLIKNSTTGFSLNLLLYLSAEFLIGAVIASFLAILNVIKSFLPKPPRDLTGDVVLIAGASSTFGESLAEEFARGGCSVICVDNDFRSVEEITARLKSRCNKVKGIGPDHRERQQENVGPTMAAYGCDLLDRNAIREIAKKIEDEVGGVDVLVTCVGQPYQDIFDTASTTLMSHYWIVLAFLPFMLQRDRAHIVGIMPVTSTQDVYLSSRIAIAGMMETLGQELSNRNNQLTFLTVSPTIARSSTRQEEQKMAQDVVEAVRRDQCSISMNWCSKMIYQISCAIHSAITTVSQWLHTQGCDYFF
ncbi:estradiol 17-beta-dehydrogenase 11 [Solenopsis invicta]|uniref:estradiol 17-beta-dehydrogenase 11 n=1 Tax=Solenopsis invicta TaxID=13686 RepID=UPI0005958B8B|nr:estradiol 17-beta-dehydrogenase 11 [Solenopsis invicta]XP_011171010.1 estradiol 17-beta-dehydrogenase 11 [Solenopsis invicta]XP_025991045.1 estradiol 17-beta-dehydrogenase 11 [Solenopsis invicta]